MDETIAIRAAALADAPVICRHRRAMFAAMGGADGAVLDAMEANFAPWLAEKMRQGSYLGWLAVYPPAEVVGGAGLWVMDWPPHLLDPAPRRGNIVNVFVEPAFRGRGLARQLTQAALAACREMGLRVVILHASPAGRPLYESLGFAATNEMRLRLD